MNAIVPAILPTSREDLEERLVRFASIEGIGCVQIDVVDGIFASPASWPYSFATTQDKRERKQTLRQMVEQGETLPYLGHLTFDIDLMVEHPEASIDDWISLGASRITVHSESTHFLSKLITDFDTKYGHRAGFESDLIALGLAVGLSTDLALIEPFLDRIDYVQMMGIAHIGHQGEPFDSRVIERIHTFHQCHPEMEIQIDGGVSRTTAPALLSAGAHRLIVGSDLVHAKDPRAEFAALEELTEEFGIYE